MKRNNLYLSLILVVFTLFSCTHRSYRMQTQVNRDGSCVRSISVETRDSAFIAGDTTANPLPIQLDTTWTVAPVRATLRISSHTPRRPGQLSSCLT